MVPQRLLQLGEGDTVKLNPTAIFAHSGAKAFDLFSCSVAGVGRTHKMDRRQLQSSFCHHISRDRTVDTARDQQESLSARTDRQATCTRDLVRVDIGAKIPNFNRYHNVGVVDIHLKMGKLPQNISAQFPHNIRGFHREAFVRSLGIHLKGFCLSQGVGQIFQRNPTNVLIVLLCHCRARKCRNPEHLPQPLYRLLKINSILFRLDINGRLCFSHIDLAQAS